MLDPVVTQSFLKKELKKFATKKELKRELKRFATKEDLKRFATKEDLKRFATREDLKGLATKKDLQPFATKVFVDMAIDDLREDIEKQMAQLRSDLMEKLDEILNIFRKDDEERTLLAHHSLQHGEQLTDHEQRIARLEVQTTAV